MRASMNISLPDPMKDFIETQAAKEGFGSVSEYLRSVMRELQKRKAREELESKLLEGLQGPAVEMTRADWDSIEQEALERVTREQTPS